MVERKGFGTGFGIKTRRVKKKTPTKLKALRSRRNKAPFASEQEKQQLLQKLSKMKKLPPDIEALIGSQAKKKIDPRVKRDLVLYARLRKTQDEYYNTHFKKTSSKAFNSIAPRYRKGFVMALEEDIIHPHRDLFEWLARNWKDIVLYIGNRKSPDEYPGIRHFIDTTYADNPPTQVKFKEIVKDANDYLWAFDAN